jgi:hypothetical protein
MSYLDGLRRKQNRDDRRARRAWIRFWVIVALGTAFALALAGEFPELAVIVP